MGGRVTAVRRVSFLATWAVLFGAGIALIAAFGQDSRLAAPQANQRVTVETAIRAPLPQGLTIQQIAPVLNGVWFLVADTRAASVRPAVYFWSETGIQNFFPASNSNDIVVRSLTTDSFGAAWLLTDQGVWHWSNGAFQHRADFDSLQPKAFVGGKDLWVVTTTDELLFLPAWQPQSAQKKSIPIQGSVTNWTQTALGELRFSVQTADGDRIWEASPASDRAFEITWLRNQISTAVAALYSDSSLNLWIGLQNGQLLRCAASACDTYGPETFTAAVRFLSLGEDSNKNLYVRLAGDPTREVSLPTLSRGIARFQSLSLEQVRGDVTAMAFDAAGGVWVATTSTGALRLKGSDNLPWLKGSGPSQRSGRGNPMNAALPLSFGGPIPLESTGINNFLSAKFAFLHTGRGMSNNQVSSITADSEGRLYFTTGYSNLLGGLGGSVAGGGVNRWDHRQFTIFTTANGLASNTVQSSFYDANTNTVWFGTSSGISRLNAANDTFFSPNLLPGVIVQAILRDGSGNIWAATNSGVYRLNPNTGATLNQFTSPAPSGNANTPNALASNNVTSMAIQDDGNVIWFGTDRGAAIGGTNELVGGISRYQINTNQWTPFNLNSPGGGGEFDSNRVIGIAVDAANNVWVSSFGKGVYRISAGNAGVPASYTRFQQSNGLGGNASNVVYSIFRDAANNLWFSFGGFGDVANPQKTAVSFLAANQVNSATPAFSNYNAANNQFPSNVIHRMFAENASTMWFGTLGGGVFRLGCPCDQPGWPQALSGYVYTSSPVLADLEGAGKLNIVVGDQAGWVYAYRHDGTRIWAYDVRNAFNPAAFSPANQVYLNNLAVQSSPSVGDVDGDGLPDVVVGVGGFAAAPPATGNTHSTRGKSPGALIVLSNTGVLKRVSYPYDITDYTLPASSQDGLPEPIFGTPLLANADDDPELEIHVGAWDNFFYSVNFDGSPIFTVDYDGDGIFDEDFLGDFTPFYPAGLLSSFIPGWPGIDDNRNGLIDEGPIFDDDEDGIQDENWPKFPFWAGDTIFSSAAAIDLYGTGRPNIIFGQDYSGAAGSPYARGGILRVLDHQGDEVPGFPKGNLEQVINSTPTVVDLADDGTLQIVHGSGLDLSTVAPNNPAALLVGQLVHAWKRDGTSFLAAGGTTGKFASTIVPGVSGSGGRSFASIAVGNLDAGFPVLVVVTTPMVDQNNNAIDANGNPTAAANTIGQMVYAFRANGTLLPGFPVRPFMFFPNPPVLGSPVIADVNGDNSPDIVVPAGYGLIAIDYRGRVISGMGGFENLQDPVSAITQESTPAIGDIDGDGILEVVWASGTSADGGNTGNGGVIRVAKLGPVNNQYYDWPMFLRGAERNPIYDILVSQPAARVIGGQVIFSAQVRHGRNPIGSVTVDLSSAGGSSVQQMFDNGTNGDPVANDGTYSLAWPIQAANRYYLTVTATSGSGISSRVRTARGTITYVQRGTGKILVASTNSVNFGTVGQGLNGDMHVNLMNIGNTAVTLGSIVSSNPEFAVVAAKSAFSDRLFVTPSSSTQASGYNGFGNLNIPPGIPGYTIAPGATLALALRVHPALTSVGTRTSTLTITSDGGNQTINLTANARVLSGGITLTTDAAGSFPATSLAYASIPLNSTALNQLYITSTGTDPLIISNITFSNPAFSVYKPDNPGFPRTYPVNTTPGSQFFGNHYRNAVPLQIQFRPTVAGSHTGAMTLFTNDPNRPTVSIALSGGGAACGVTVDQPTINVSAGPSVVIFNVIAASGCTWTLQSNVPWLNILLNVNGDNTANITLSGNRALALDIRRNASSVARQGTVTINGAVVTVSQAGSTDVTNLRYIYVCFNNFLAREPGAAGVDFFLPLLNSGQLSRTQMAFNFFGAPEFNAIERFVIGLYYGILGRDPEFYGWDYHRRNLHIGIVNQDTLVTQFLATAEYAARYGNPTNDQFVTLLFQNALGRTPTPSDVAAWSTLLANGTLTRTQVAQSFLNSPEFQTGVQARQTVFLLHATMLSRDPGTAGYSAWLGYFNSPGSTLEAAVNAFVLSPEFQAKLGPN